MKEITEKEGDLEYSRLRKRKKNNENNIYK